MGKKRERNDLSNKCYLVFASSSNISTEVDLLLCQRPATGYVSIIKDTLVLEIPGIEHLSELLHRAGYDVGDREGKPQVKSRSLVSRQLVRHRPLLRADRVRMLLL